MEYYYLDARTNDTICSYQIQTPQIETHITQEEVKGCNGAWGIGYQRKDKENKRSSSNSKQSNEIKT